MTIYYEEKKKPLKSAGSLPQGLNEAGFFDGFSIPRNKELMRIYKDLELVGQLDSKSIGVLWQGVF